ncbi:NHLP family bacteriocin export ABC transporter peptidase/permease/ATPase [Planobispora rosea]|uniref:NHLP family bacteriocin export ABC transporter peptidase/permease/ATPase n=1 Tax=Planobispora rosea TaxID=35762 RepID=A0A8J3S4Z5_PLARO|nr:NHLP family bacteriocin export ABC transporter peptidase/permease/ATPase subunit [Planobispora rosea]GGS93533.1 NHLP family bacteriocin export ABC transporter peptidase/permease/ATPase [Planobispora rosea]GIH87278.1 NHLP family bacteriocin export ABC transporter peptidase/permease/ATPase [Planobispora rosea]
MTQTTAPPPEDTTGERTDTILPSSSGRRTRRWRTRTPTVIQMESVECGAASLAMVLAHYGRFVPLEELRTACGVSRDGANAKNLLDAARSYGLEAKGFQIDTADLLTVRGPYIIFWAFQHFMVVEGIRTRRGRRYVAVNDPASGPRTVTWDDFDSGFTGIVLTFEPGPGFERGGKRPRLIDALLRRRMPTGGALSLVLLASLLLVVLGLTGPAYFRVFIDRVLTDPGSGFLPPLLLAMTATAAGLFALTAIQRLHLLRIEFRMALVSSGRFFRHLLRLPVEFYLQRQPAEVAKRVSVNDNVAELLSRDLAATGLNLVLVLFYGFILLRYDLLLGVIGSGMALLNILVLHWVARARTDAVTKLRTDQGRLTATTFNTLQLIETIKATGAEAQAFARWSGFLAKVTTAKQQLGLPTTVISVVPALLATANTGLILLIGGLRVLDGAISIGMLVAFQSLLTALSRPVTQLTELGERVQDITADVNRLHDVERYGEDPAFRRATGKDEERLDGYLEFRNVTFGYGPLAPLVLRDLSFSLVPGRRVAIVGGSGSGKSTVGRLVAGLFEQRSGEILIDGRPRREVGHEAFAASVAFVDQEVALFEGTVRDNLTLWDDSISDDVVNAALRDAMIFDVIAARPGGINSVVHEGGRNFSGGQRQRLEIARALVSDPTLLILDEATSALDAETERIIADNLHRRGCSCLIIAHRLSTIRDADEIIVLEHGEIVERGHHGDLVELGGRYAALVDSAAGEGFQ